jgi:type I restriction enzyme S subunit
MNRADRDYAIGRGIAAIRGRDPRDTDFIQYCIEYRLGDLLQLASGSTFPNLTARDIGGLIVPYPADRREVAGILSAYDDLIQNNYRRIATLEEMGDQIYGEWFVDYRYPGREGMPLVDSDMGQIPQGWEVRALGALCSLIQAGGTPPRSSSRYWRDGTVDWYKTAELRDGFLFGSVESVSQSAVVDRKTRVFPAGAILMAIYGSPTVGRLGVLAREGACNQAALAMVGNAVPQSILYHMLRGLRGHFNAIAQGAAQQNISKEKVEAARVVCPPPALCAAADALLKPILAERRALEEAVRSLRTTRDFLIPWLVAGEGNVEGLAVVLEGTEG